MLKFTISLFRTETEGSIFIKFYTEITIFRLERSSEIKNPQKCMQRYFKGT